jgi:hypothetical protein
VGDQASNGHAGGAPTRDWVEIVATLLLALASVAMAWSSYQATRWNGEQARRYRPMIGGCLTTSSPDPRVGQPGAQQSHTLSSNHPVLLVWGVASEALREIMTGFLDEVRFD